MRQTITLTPDGLLPVGIGKRHLEKRDDKYVWEWYGKTRSVPRFIEAYAATTFTVDGIPEYSVPERHYRMVVGKNLEDGYVMWRGGGDDPIAVEIDTYDIFDTKAEMMAEYSQITKRAEDIRRGGLYGYSG